MQTVTLRFSASTDDLLQRDRAVGQALLVVHARRGSPRSRSRWAGPRSAHAFTRSIIPGTMTAWCSRRLSPSGIRVTPFAIAQVRPCLCTTGQSAGSSSSIDERPIRLAATARSSSGIFW